MVPKYNFVIFYDADIFPAFRSVLLMTKEKLSRNMNTPVPISRIRMEMISPRGPNTAIPRGIIRVDIMVNTPKTLPIKGSYTRDCKIVIEGTLNRGMTSPINPILTRNSQKLVAMPSSAEPMPQRAQERAIEKILFLNPPQVLIKSPPRSIPAENVISTAVRRHTSAPKSRVT